MYLGLVPPIYVAEQYLKQENVSMEHRCPGWHISDWQETNLIIIIYIVNVYLKQLRKEDTYVLITNGLW